MNQLNLVIIITQSEHETFRKFISFHKRMKNAKFFKKHLNVNFLKMRCKIFDLIRAEICSKFGFLMEKKSYLFFREIFVGLKKGGGLKWDLDETF